MVKEDDMGDEEKMETKGKIEVVAYIESVAKWKEKRAADALKYGPENLRNTIVICLGDERRVLFVSKPRHCRRHTLVHRADDVPEVGAIRFY